MRAVSHRTELVPPGGRSGASSEPPRRWSALRS